MNTNWKDSSGRVAYLEAALRELATPKGVWSRDAREFAENTIDDMKEIATGALAGTWEADE